MFCKVTFHITGIFTIVTSKIFLNVIIRVQVVIIFVLCTFSESRDSLFSFDILSITEFTTTVISLALMKLKMLEKVLVLLMVLQHRERDIEWTFSLTLKAGRMVGEGIETPAALKM